MLSKRFELCHLFGKMWQVEVVDRLEFEGASELVVVDGAVRVGVLAAIVQPRLLATFGQEARLKSCPSFGFR